MDVRMNHIRVNGLQKSRIVQKIAPMSNALSKEGGLLMDHKRAFNQTWEVEYLCERVRKIADAVQKGNYESALDMLDMLRDKTAAAKHLILQIDVQEENK